MKGRKRVGEGRGSAEGADTGDGGLEGEEQTELGEKTVHGKDSQKFNLKDEDFLGRGRVGGN